ncbi:hypothetical protein AB0M28_30770 [Streptomyces sp. NPDC051940]|uniref:hypothetical protein n=1 Tax=Streptomyces sp. NPDC051940 TaxID=3155675 RepID=UPI0034322955
MTMSTTAKSDDIAESVDDVKDADTAAVLESEESGVGELDAEEAFEDEGERSGSGVVAGAGAVVAAGLGVASLTGTWIGDLMSTRQTVIGQINSQSGTTAEQLSAIYGTPWHTVALFNGLFALVAVLVAVGVLLRPVFATDARPAAVWVRATAVAGLVLGVLGLLIAGVMWFDVFTDLPKIPTATQ